MPVKIGTTTLYDLKELSKRFGLSLRTLRLYLREGKISGQKLGRKWFVSEETLKNYFEQKGPKKK